ncbi:MAG TPA: SDR family NAD(P)-dependent oxidoreductase [Mycobacteriales bacterium]|nr:SDR family NAD(P)-dependent oxidoreductase [Mycobacteriales bacterium]
MTTAGQPLAGRVALVTGAGRGIGRAHALTLAARGATVMVNDIGASVEGTGLDEGPARAVVAEIGAAGGQAKADHTDIASIDGGGRAVTATIDAFGRIDILINNAGFALGGARLPRTTADAKFGAAVDALLAVHYKAAVGTMAAAFTDMRRRGWGRVVNTVSEVAVDVRSAGALAYGAAKAAVWSATLAAAHEGAADGITVNAISPGARTRMNADLLDEGFRGGASAQLDLNPMHVARLVAYLASDEASDITGQVLHVAAGAVREYRTIRTSRSPLVERLTRALETS